MRHPDPLGPGPFCFEEFFREGLHIACPGCGRHLVARFGFAASQLPYWERRMTVLCQSCGFDRSSGQSYAYWMDGVSLRSRVVSPWLGRRARSVAAGALQAGAAGGVKAEIWANLRLHGEEIVALNPWHLQAMRAYIAPLVRPECCAESVASQDWRTRLPDWMKLGANRKAVLTVLDRLRRRLDDGA